QGLVCHCLKHNTHIGGENERPLHAPDRVLSRTVQRCLVNKSHLEQTRKELLEAAKGSRLLTNWVRESKTGGKW
ncbi:hypothetical protein ILYODFUR_035290, partial [Ilyodon furcidens]